MVSFAGTHWRVPAVRGGRDVPAEPVGGPCQMIRNLCLFVTLCCIDLLLGQSTRPGEVGPGEVSLAKVGPGEVSLAKVGPGEDGSGEVSSREGGPNEGGPEEERLGEGGLGEGGLEESGFGKVGPDEIG